MRHNLWLTLAGLVMLATTTTTACGATRPIADPPVEATREATVRAFLATPEPRERGAVVELVDGETLALALDDSEVPVRLLSIATPAADLNECFAGAAASFVAAVAPPGMPLELEPDGIDADAAGMRPRYVFLTDGSMLNEQLVRGGFARVTDEDGGGKYLERLQDAEDEARRDGLGLWGDCRTPTPTAFVAAPTTSPTAVATAAIVSTPAPTTTPAPTPPPTATPSPPPTVVPTPTPTTAPTATPTAAPTPAPTAIPTATAAPPPQNCDPSYPTVCIPPKSLVGDLNCGDITHRRFAVLPPDPHGFDGNNDGVGCQS